MNFNNGTRPQPLAPEMRRMDQVIRDLNTGRLDTNTRYGRKQMWKPEESQRYLQVLLEGRTLTDPISIGRHVQGGRTSEPAVNGNNRLRSIRKFVRNEIGVKAEEDGRVYTYYYSEIPDHVRGRNCRVLSAEVQNAFHDYPIPFNVRPNLTEQEEIAWYRELNTSLHAHTSGHLLVADICEASDFATALLRHFPAVKERISEDESPEDVHSLGTFLIELSGCEPDFLHGDDKKENVLLAHAGLLNLLANGSPYNGGWTGVFGAQALEENVASLRHILAGTHLSDEMRAEWMSPVNRQPYMQRFYHLNYLLGPIAWSLGTKKPDAVDTWMRFLGSARPGTIQDVYLGDIAAENGVKDAKKFQFAWERVQATVYG